MYVHCSLRLTTTGQLRTQSIHIYTTRRRVGENDAEDHQKSPLNYASLKERRREQEACGVIKSASDYTL